MVVHPSRVVVTVFFFVCGLVGCLYIFKHQLLVNSVLVADGVDLMTSAPFSSTQDMNHFRTVFVTVPNIEVAKKIATGLVSNKLAACVNIIPHVTSVYEWEGKINEDSELILMIKSQESLFSDLEKFVKENHPYDVPEVIALPIQQGSQTYLDWIGQVTSKK